MYIAMVVDRRFRDSESERGDRLESSVEPLGRPMALHAAQQQIYSDLLAMVKSRTPVEALAEFEALFFSPGQMPERDLSPALHQILLAGDQAEFYNTLKRACYILINTWDLARQGHMIQAMLSLFQQHTLSGYSAIPGLQRLHQWLGDFIASPDFEALKLFAHQRIGPTQPGGWSDRYVAYHLVTQYIDKKNSPEQCAAARTLSKRLKTQFRYDLAMYTAFEQQPSRLGNRYSNPTVLGDGVLRLVKTILLRQGRFNHRHVARLFLQQTDNTPYASYKANLVDYFCFAISQPEFVSAVEKHIGERLRRLYAKHDDHVINSSLTLRTCNRIIDALTTEDESAPSNLFALLLAQGNSMNIAVLLLKILLISPKSQLYLEARLANLVDYYKQFMEVECRSVIQFLEICAVTFAIYSQSVEYNLVKLTDAPVDLDADLEEFRIFSRIVKAAQKRAQDSWKPKSQPNKVSD
ncbi:hypothetical protein BH23CYA1_BH23CYA1_07860 [soil metagenome]